MAAQEASGEIEVEGTLRSLVDLLGREKKRLQEWLEAKAHWIDVRSMPTKGRRDKVRLTRTLHTMSFVEVLLDEAAAAGSPAESEEFSYLALLVAQQLPDARISAGMKNDLCAECCIEIANSRRRQAKWPAAREAVRKANEYIERDCERDSETGVVKGKILSVLGALEDDLGNTEEARKLLRSAAGLFEAARETFLTSRTLVQMAYILADSDPPEGLQIVQEASRLIPPNNPRLVWLAETIRINCLITMGSPHEALMRFRDLRKLQEQFREPFVQIRSRFTAARILEHLGRHQQAEKLFQEVVADDLEHGFVKDFFLDLVYLLGFHIRGGQSPEAIAVCRRAVQELSLLENEEGSGETARDQMQEVWRSLEEGVKKGNVGQGATVVLRNYIRSHWRVPAVDPPSFKKGPA
jgi:tetratricopeptide (TPR) repeat protein